MKHLYFLFLLFLNSSFLTGSFDWFSSFNLFKNRKAVHAYRQQDYQQAANYYDDLLTDDPYNPVYNYNVGDILYKQQKYQDAHHAFLRASQHAQIGSKLQEQAFFNAGNSCYKLEAWKQAVQAYQDVLKINKDNQSAQHNLQLALYKLQEQQMQNKSEEKEEKKQDSSQKNNQQQQADKNQNQQASQDKNKSESSSADGQDDEDGNDGQGQSDKNESSKSGKQQKKSEQDGTSQEKQKSGEKEKADGQDGKDQGESGDEESLDEQDGQGADQEQNKVDQSEKDGLENKGQRQGQEKDQLRDDKEKDLFDQNYDEMGNGSQDDIGAASGDLSDEQEDKKGAVGGYKKPELKNALQDEYESKASDDERLNDYHAKIMKELEDLEEKIQKHVIKNKVAMQGAGQNEKKGW